MRTTILKLLALAMLVGPMAAKAAPVIYVDPGDHSSDYLTVLTNLGYSYTTFDSYSDASWSGAIAAADVILVGERHSVHSSTSGATQASLGTFVSGGGTFVGHFPLSSSGGMDEFMNAAFGTSLVYSTFGCGSSNTDTLNAGAAAGTSFAGGPASIDDPSCTGSVTTASVLASGMLSIYDDLSGNTSVAAGSFGAGGFSMLGWDFCTACAPGDVPTWSAVLDSAIKWTGASTTVPEPGSLALLGLGLFGMSFTRRRKQA